jgi:hypothetical protein
MERAARISIGAREAIATVEVAGINTSNIKAEERTAHYGGACGCGRYIPTVGDQRWRVAGGGGVKHHQQGTECGKSPKLLF